MAAAAAAPEAEAGNSKDSLFAAAHLQESYDHFMPMASGAPVPWSPEGLLPAAYPLRQSRRSLHAASSNHAERSRVLASAMPQNSGFAENRSTIEHMLRSQQANRFIQSPPVMPPKADSPPPGLVLEAVPPPTNIALQAAMKAVAELPDRQAVPSTGTRLDGLQRLARQNSGRNFGHSERSLGAQQRKRTSSYEDLSPAELLKNHRLPHRSSQEKLASPRRQNRSSLSAQWAPTNPAWQPLPVAGTITSPSNKRAGSERPARPTSGSGSGSRPSSRAPDSPATTSVRSLFGRRGNGASSSCIRRRGKHPTLEAVVGPPPEPSFPSSLSSGWAPCLASSSGTKRKAPKREVQLIRSVFEGRPPVLLFDYSPKIDEPPKKTDRAIQEEDLSSEGFNAGLPKMFFYHEKSKDVHEYNAVLNTLNIAGLYRTFLNSGKWSLNWAAHPSADLLRSFHRFQKTNHFPGSWHIGRKDFLWKNIHRMKRQFPQQYDIMPITFIMPDDFAAWAAYREQKPNALWIYKPANSACGRGIKLLGSNSSPAADKKLREKNGIIQRYVDRPMKINGFKFDLRLYVVVTSYDPLKAYFFEEGLVRLATTRYERPTTGNLNRRTMHLTNYSVNKHSESYVKNLSHGASVATLASVDDEDDEGDDTDCDANVLGSVSSPKSVACAEFEHDDGEEDVDEAEDDEECKSPEQPTAAGSNDDEAAASKWSFGQLREYCASTGQDYDQMMSSIKDLIVKTLVAVEPPIINTWHQGANYSTSGLPTTQVGPNQTCFEIYGFDVMVDDRLKPWLLEVNIFPSISSSSPFDKRVKTMMIADTLTLVGLLPFAHDLVDKAVKDEQKKRLQGLQQKHSSSVTRTHTINTVGTAALKELGEAEWQLILDTHDEFMRRGHFERIYPTRDRVERLAPFFATPRYSNLLLARWIEEGGEQCFLPEGRGDIPPWVPRLVSTESC